MKKQELIHLHGLLAEIENRYNARTDDELDLSTYRATGVNPTSIHRSKTAHKEAVFALAVELANEMNEEETRVAPHAD